MEEITFIEMIRRVRLGDERCAAALVQRYAPQVQRIVRVRLRDQNLRRVLDSMDICQSVMADFFIRAALGQFELNTSDDLLKLLATMARNRLTNHALKQHAQKRDVSKVESLGDQALYDTGPSPSGEFSIRELLQKSREKMSDAERRIAELRCEGRTWGDIASHLGETSDAVRVRLDRAMNRVSRELGLCELNDDE